MSQVYDAMENSLKLINTQLGRDKDRHSEVVKGKKERRRFQKCQTNDVASFFTLIIHYFQTTNENFDQRLLMCRFLQYFIKFIVPVVASRGPQNNDIKDRLEKLAGNMSLTRKVLRFGKPIPLKPVRLFWLRTINDISLILYFLSDHPLYFNRIGFVKLEKDSASRIDYFNNLTWLINAVLDVVCDLLDFQYYQTEIKKLRSQQDAKSKEVQQLIKKLEMDSFGKILSVIRAGSDIPVVFHFMGNENISSGFAGFLGCISSSVSLYNLWGK